MIQWYNIIYYAQHYIPNSLEIMTANSLNFSNKKSKDLLFYFCSSKKNCKKSLILIKKYSVY